MLLYVWTYITTEIVSPPIPGFVDILCMAIWLSPVCRVHCGSQNLLSPLIWETAMIPSLICHNKDVIIKFLKIFSLPFYLVLQCPTGSILLIVFVQLPLLTFEASPKAAGIDRHVTLLLEIFSQYLQRYYICRKSSFLLQLCSRRFMNHQWRASCYQQSSFCQFSFTVRARHLAGPFVPEKTVYTM